MLRWLEKTRLEKSVETVHYKLDPDNCIKVNERAIVVVFDHPILGNNHYLPVLTSRVTTIDGNIFNTLNHTYVGVDKESDICETLCL